MEAAMSSAGSSIMNNNNSNSSNPSKKTPTSTLQNELKQDSNPKNNHLQPTTTTTSLSPQVSRSESSTSVASTESYEQADEENRMDYEEKPASVIEEELFRAVCDGNRLFVKDLLQKYRPSALLQVFLTFSYVNRGPQSDSIHTASKMNMQSIQGLHNSMAHPGLTQMRQSPLNQSNCGNISSSPPAINNTAGNSPNLSAASSTTGNDRGSPARSSMLLTSTKNLSASFNSGGQSARPYFTFDPEIIQDAHELLGTGVSPLNLIQIACMLGDEELAIDILEFMYENTIPKGQKLLLMEFLGKTWGDGNITLHLASFQGMSDLVKQMLKYGASAMKTNGRGYRPVDCADDDTTRKLFRSYITDNTKLGGAAAIKKDLQPKKAFSFSGGESPAIKPKVSLHPLHEKNELKSIQGSSTISGVTGISPIPSVAISASAPVTPSGVSSASGSPSSRLQSKSEPETPILSQLQKLSLISSMKSTDSLPRITAAAPNSTRRIYWEPNCLLLDYAKNGELELIRALIRKVEEKSPPSPTTRSSNSAIFSTGDVHASRYSFGGALDFNCSTPHTGLTPLHLACSYGHLPVAKFLIEEAKADLQVRDTEGWTVLHSCIAEVPDPETFPNSITEEEKKDRERFLQVLKYLVSLPGIDLKAMTDDGETVFDVVKEIDDNGTIDMEVHQLLEDSMSGRGINVKRLVGADSDVDEQMLQQQVQLLHQQQQQQQQKLTQTNYLTETKESYVPQTQLNLKDTKPRQTPLNAPIHSPVVTSSPSGSRKTSESMVKSPTENIFSGKLGSKEAPADSSSTNSKANDNTKHIYTSL